MGSRYDKRYLRTIDIHCSRCGATGSIIWEFAPAFDGNREEIVAIGGGFYERLSKNKPYVVELVCSGCGTAEPCQIQPWIKLSGDFAAPHGKGK